MTNATPIQRDPLYVVAPSNSYQKNENYSDIFLFGVLLHFNGFNWSSSIALTHMKKFFLVLKLGDLYYMLIYLWACAIGYSRVLNRWRKR